MAVTLGQGLGQSDSTYPVIAKSTRKKPIEDLYADGAIMLFSYNLLINHDAPHTKQFDDVHIKIAIY